MYQCPDMITPGVDPQGQPLDPRKIQDHFEDFYDLFEELNKYGEIESLNICDNLADHMVGNVYVQFREEEHAANALQNLSGRFYAATCWQYEENVCDRGGYCNFMHLKKISRGGGVVEAEAVVLSGIAIMMSIHMVVAVVMVVELITQVSARMIGAGGLEAGALEEGEDEAGVLEEKETGVQLGKAVLIEGQKLSNGIGKKKRQNLVTKMRTILIIMATIDWQCRKWRTIL